MKVREMGRERLEAIAKIVGPNSACAQALIDADTHDGPVRFFETDRGTILVEKASKTVETT